MAKQARFSIPIAREILFTAWPTMLQVLMNTAVQYVDLAMVGTLGTNATAAIGATTAVNWLVNGSVSALSTGFLVHISMAHGAGEHRRVRQIVEQTILTTLVWGILLTCMAIAVSPFIAGWMQVEDAVRPMAQDYFLLYYSPMLLRTATIMFGNVLWAVGDTKTPMLVSILVNIVNVLGNLFLIFPSRQLWNITIPGAGLGVIGAGIASFIAFFVEALCIFLALWRNRTVFPGLRQLRLNKTILLPCLRTAIPNLLQRFTSSLAAIVFSSMVNSLGAAATAAHTLVHTIEALCGCDFRNVSAPMAGQAVGSPQPNRLLLFRHTILVMETGLTILYGGLLFLLAPRLLSFFTTDPAVLSLGTGILRMMALAEPIFRCGQIMEGFLQGSGNTTTPFVYQSLTVWPVQIAGTWICIGVLGMGLLSAWICTIAQYGLLLLLYAHHHHRYTASP